jgi:hypothetical protein
MPPEISGAVYHAATATEQKHGNGMSKRTEVTIEQHEVTIIHNSGRSGAHRLLPDAPQRAWCPFCEQEVTVLTAETAAQVGGVSRREIYRRIESGELHFNETAEGVVQVCLTSLHALQS